MIISKKVLIAGSEPGGTWMKIQALSENKGENL